MPKNNSQGDQVSYLPLLSVVFGISLHSSMGFPLLSFPLVTLKSIHVCVPFLMVVPSGSQGIRTDPEEKRDEACLVTRLWLRVWPSC